MAPAKLRSAFIGLSGPVAYDYKNQTDRQYEREGSAPNPLLEDGLGLLLMYDELVFLSPHLCPANMRELSYVRFLNKAPEFPEKFRVLAEQSKTVFDSVPKKSEIPRPWDRWGPAIRSMTGQDSRMTWDDARFVTDNHTHQLYLAHQCSAVGDSTRVENVIMDWLIHQAFDLKDCDIVSNSGNFFIYEALSKSDVLPKDDVSAPFQRMVAHHLIARRLPGYLSESGPYHECMEELRHHDFVSDARKHIDEIVESGEDALSVAERITQIAREHRDRIFKRHLARANEYWVAGRAAATELAGLALPGFGFVDTLITASIAERERQKLRWAGFLVDIDEFPAQKSSKQETGGHSSPELGDTRQQHNDRDQNGAA